MGTESHFRLGSDIEREYLADRSGRVAGDAGDLRDGGAGDGGAGHGSVAYVAELIVGRIRVRLRRARGCGNFCAATPRRQSLHRFSSLYAGTTREGETWEHKAWATPRIDQPVEMA